MRPPGCLSLGECPGLHWERQEPGAGLVPDTSPRWRAVPRRPVGSLPGGLRRRLGVATVSLERVRKEYKGGVVAAKDVTLEIADGEFVSLVGPSGCGKSTTLNLIAGLEEMSGGELRIDGVVVNDMSPRERDIAMVFQSYALYPHMDVRGNLAFPLKVSGLDKGSIDAAGERDGGAARVGEAAGAPAEGAVRRAAAARGARAGAGAQAEGVPVRRAAVEPGRGAAHADAGGDQEAARAAGGDVHLRHARPGRGDDAVGPGGGDEPGGGAAGGAAARAVRRTGEPVRGGVLRLAAHQPGEAGDAGAAGRRG